MQIGDLVQLKCTPDRLGILVRLFLRGSEPLVAVVFWVYDQRCWSFYAEDLEVLCK